MRLPNPHAVRPACAAGSGGDPHAARQGVLRDLGHVPIVACCDGRRAVTSGVRPPAAAEGVRGTVHAPRDPVGQAQLEGVAGPVLGRAGASVHRRTSSRGVSGCQLHQQRVQRRARHRAHRMRPLHGQQRPGRVGVTSVQVGAAQARRDVRGRPAGRRLPGRPAPRRAGAAGPAASWSKSPGTSGCDGSARTATVACTASPTDSPAAARAAATASATAPLPGDRDGAPVACLEGPVGGVEVASTCAGRRRSGRQSRPAAPGAHRTVLGDACGVVDRARGEQRPHQPPCLVRRGW